MRFRAALPLSTPIFLLVFVAIIFLPQFFLLSNDPKMRLELGPAHTVEGRVLTVREVSGCNGGAHVITYSFSSDDAREFRGTKDVCERSAYYSVVPGDKLPVRYLSRDPTVNTISDNTPAKAPALIPLVIFPFFFLFLFSFIYLPPIREVMRARRLYRTGTLATATVLYVKQLNSFMNWNRQGNVVSEVHVLYQDPSGRNVETVVACRNDWLTRQLVPKAVVHLLLPDVGSRGRPVLLEAFIR